MYFLNPGQISTAKQFIIAFSNTIISYTALNSKRLETLYLSPGQRRTELEQN